MRPLAVCLLLALAAPIYAADAEPMPDLKAGQVIAAVGVLKADGGATSPGKEVQFKCKFAVAPTFHAYHKNTKGYSKPLSIVFTELSGLIQKGEETWPSYHENPDPSDPSKVEWELSGNFEIVYTFRVPASAKDRIKVSASFEAQVCDEGGCQDEKGVIGAELPVVPIDVPPKLDTKALEEKVAGLTDEVAGLKKELKDTRKTLDDLTNTLKDYIAAQRAKEWGSGAKDAHGFYQDFDFAFAEAKKQGKLLLVDFNGER